MILSGHPSVSLEQCLSDTAERMLIWSNLLLDRNFEVSKEFKIKFIEIIFKGDPQQRS